jgi:dolichol-phosphate mannosyltransferase
MSFLPLKLAGYLGMLIIAVAGPLGLFIFIENYLLHDPLNLNFSGPAILGVIILFLVGIILVCLGLIALYIANIHSEVSNRPLYIVRRKRQ